MKKIIYLLILLSLAFCPIEKALADNTHSAVFDTTDVLRLLYASQTNLNDANDFSLETWAKFDAVSGFYTLIDKNGSSGGYRGYDFGMAYTNQLYADVNLNGTTATRLWSDTTFTFSTGTWYHIAVTYDASAGEGIFYLNGSQLGDKKYSGYSVRPANSNTFWIGANYVGNYDIVGNMDDVRVWNDVRTPTEIAANYNIELNGDESGLVAYYKFNNDSFVDYTSNNNDLTNINTVEFSTDVPFTGITPAIIRKKSSSSQSDIY